MKTIKTARGKVLDMSAIAAKHEKTRAVSNAPINARGDIIDSRGDVKVSRGDIKNKFYKDTVPGSDETQVNLNEEPKKSKPKSDGPTIVSQLERTRDDGTPYMEIEYSDGSMEDYDIDELGNRV